MLTRFKWFVSGAFLAALAIAGGGLWLQADRRRGESLRAEQERLTRKYEALRQQAEQLERDRRQLAEIVEHLKLERRVAQVDVLEQHTDADGQVMETVMRLTEIGRDGAPLPAQVFGIRGRVPHFDALVIKFKDDYVGRGDPLRGTSLALFRRVYGETQAPEDGYWLGRRGEVPDVYRVSAEPSEFEVNLWREFWSYALDPAKARAAGVRVAQGEAVYAPMTSGERWLLTLEIDGGLNLIKHPSPSPDTAGSEKESGKGSGISFSGALCSHAETFPASEEDS
ncbi:MAG: hypothetical protein V2A79_05065 [Planctomycetota bacterium]